MTMHPKPTSSDEHARLVARIAELEQAVAAATEKAAFWQRMLEASPTYISLFDDQSRFLYLNYNAPEYAGHDVRGQVITDYVLPEYRQTVDECFQSVLRTGQPSTYEAKDANHWYHNSLGPITFPDGKRGVVIVTRGIDKEKEIERELRDARELWNSLFSNSPDTIILCDSENRVLFINRTTPPYKLEDVVGRIGTEFVVPECRAAMENAIREASQTGSPRIYEFQDILAQMWWRVTCVPVRDSQRGDLVLSISQDITDDRRGEEALRAAHDELELRVGERTKELDQVNRTLREDICQRERVEQELRESEERFRIIADTVPVAVVITRLKDGLIVYCNRRTGELFATPPEVILGRPSTDFYVDPAQRHGLIERLHSEETVLDLELWMRSPAGKELLVSGHYQRISYDGEPCILTGFIDLTKRIENEQALKQERRLLKRLLELNERDRQLISYEIHDGIVQDMTAAQMFFESSRPADLPEDHATNEAFASGVRLLSGSINEARRIINGLRPPVLEDDGVVAAIEALIGEMERDAGIKIELVVDVKFHRLAPALEMAIYRLVQEGLNNVWHHSRSPTARVELVQREDVTEIRIEDKGIGFDPAKVSKRRYGLTGMRERARLLNGRAVIDSSPGQGTRLLIELPLVDALMPTEE